MSLSNWCYRVDDETAAREDFRHACVSRGVARRSMGGGRMLLRGSFERVDAVRREWELGEAEWAPTAPIAAWLRRFVTDVVRPQPNAKVYYWTRDPRFGVGVLSAIEAAGLLREGASVSIVVDGASVKVSLDDVAFCNSASRVDLAEAERTGRIERALLLHRALRAKGAMPGLVTYARAIGCDVPRDTLWPNGSLDEVCVREWVDAVTREALEVPR